jgi:poly[(R)-3-hydroxyalkanoate] polymerase subunit PhaC
VKTQDGPAGANPALAAFFGEQHRMLNRLLSVPRVVEAAWRTRVGTTPRKVVLSEGTHTLLHYERETPPTQAEPILLCYALINRPYILDLQPDKSVVRQYLARGFDVYMIDWGAPSHADRVLTIDHYVCGFLARAVDFIRRQHDQAKVHLTGYCMGGTFAAMHTALDPGSVKTLTLLAAPIDFGGRESLLNLWAESRFFEVDALVDAYGNCPAWFLQSCFLNMNPIRNFFEKSIAFYEQMDDPEKVSSHFALERWLNDNIPVAGETFREFVKKLYQRNELVRGEFRLGDRRVDLGCITCPLLLLTANSDHLVAPASTEGIRPTVGSRDVKSMSIGGGHVGLVVGLRAHETFWPEATRWVVDRSTNPAEARARLAAVSSSPRQNVVKRGEEFEPRWWPGDRWVDRSEVARPSRPSRQPST